MGAMPDRDRHAYIALLRGINVGGNKKVPMARLATVVADAGASDVRTYIQSGNVVFAHRAGEAELRADLEHRIAEAFGFDVPVVLRTGTEMAAVVGRNPYTGVEPTKLLVAFLAEPPGADVAAAVDRAAFGREEFTVDGREVYLHLPDGAGRSKLVPALGRSLLKAPATTRNWRTVETLSAMAAA
jgi:uncharacterized protein (DUF1697 family)